MGETIFSVLRGLEHTRLSPYSSGVFRTIISFVENGACSGSKVDKFIMENFRLSPTKLTELWNKRFNGNKSANTFRGQISQLSSYICSIFDCTAQELNDAFVVGDVDILRGISDIIGVFPYGSLDLTDAFIGYGLLPVDSLEGNYSIADCQQELHLLQSLDRRVIQSKIARADAGKLSYVLGVLSQPLVTDIYVKTEGKKKRLKTARVNRDKVQFLKALLLQTPHLSMPEAEVHKNILGCPDAPVPAETSNTVPSAPYSLGLSGQLMAILQSEAMKYEALPEDIKEKLQAQSDKESQKKAMGFLRLFTADVFKKQLKNMNPYDLYMALEKYKA